MVILYRFDPTRLTQVRGGLSYDAAASRLGRHGLVVSGRTFRRWESAEAEPSAPQLAVIATAFRRSPGWFYVSGRMVPAGASPKPPGGRRG